MLIDQGRDDTPSFRSRSLYKTRNNTIRDNEMTFEGSACVGGASDVELGHANFSVIEGGNNRFDRNVYRVPRLNGQLNFVWGHTAFDWAGFQANGEEGNGKLIRY
jgi:hypothetical protein